MAVRVPTVGGKTLFGWYCPPSEQHPSDRPAPGLVAMHGWGSNADGLLPLAGPLQAAGYGVLLLDARCHGRSDDDTFASLPRFAEDLSRGVDWLRDRPEIDSGRLVALGHSVGAGAALLTGSRRKDLAAVVSLAAFAHPEEVMRRTLSAWRIPYQPLGWLTNRYVERIIGHRFRHIAPLHTVTQQNAPVLLLHGDRDTVVPIKDMERLRQAAMTAGRTVESIPLRGVTHHGLDAETGASLMEPACRVILAFLQRWITTTAAEERTPPPQWSGGWPQERPGVDDSDPAQEYPSPVHAPQNTSPTAPA